MILVDAGPLIAIIDRGEGAHEACVRALSRISAPMITTWPAFTEAMYLLGSGGGWKAQGALWLLTERDDLQIVDLDGSMRTRARVLMAKYSDVPMDLADASLVAVAEAVELKRIFTLDRDFTVYRFKGRQRFEVVP